MKKIFLFAAAVVAAMTANAADKTWNFAALFTADNKPTFTIGDGATPDALIADELYVYGNAKDKAWDMDFGQSPKYFVDFLTAEDQVNEKLARLKSGGAGSVSADKIKGAIAFKVAGASTIKIAAVSSNGSAVRKMVVLDAAGNEIQSFKFDGNVGKKNAEGVIVDEPFTVEYNGGATTIYIISAEAVEGDDSYAAGGINYYKISATNVASWSSSQAIEDVKDAVKAEKFYRDGQLIIRKNGVEYNALGAKL